MYTHFGKNFQLYILDNANSNINFKFVLSIFHYMLSHGLYDAHSSVPRKKCLAPVGQDSFIELV